MSTIRLRRDLSLFRNFTVPISGPLDGPPPRRNIASISVANEPSRDFGSPSRARAEPSLPLEVNEPSRAYIPQLGHKPSRAEPMSRLGSGLGEPGSAGSVKCKDKRTFNLPEVYGNRIPNYTSTQLLNLASTFCHHSFSHSSISILFSSVSEFSSSSFSSASFAAGCTSSDKSRRLLPGTNGVPLLLR